MTNKQKKKKPQTSQPPASTTSATEAKEWDVKQKVRYAVFVGSLLAFISTYVLVQRLLCWDFLSPLQETAAQISLPGAMVSFLALIFVFFDKSEIQKQFRKWIQGRIENSALPYVLMFLSICLLAVAFAVGSLYPPRPWVEFINTSFLAGEEDNYSAAQAVAESLRSCHPKEADLLNRGIDVFRERRRVNNQHQNGQVDLEKLTQLKRFLETHPATQEQMAAFWSYAFAEAFSLVGDSGATNAYALARTNYIAFLRHPNRAITPKWKNSANLNFGNTFWYESNWKRAYEIWSQQPPSSRREGNRAAALIRLQNYTQAINVSLDGLKLLETQPSGATGVEDSRAVLVANLMVAFMATNGFVEAIQIFEKEYLKTARIPDGELDANYAIALLFAGRDQSFQERMATDRLIRDATRNLIWGLALLKRGDSNDSFAEFSNAIEPKPDVALSKTEITQKTKQNLDYRGLLSCPQIAKMFP